MVSKHRWPWIFAALETLKLVFKNRFTISFTIHVVLSWYRTNYQIHISLGKFGVFLGPARLDLEIKGSSNLSIPHLRNIERTKKYVTKEKHNYNSTKTKLTSISSQYLNEEDLKVLALVLSFGEDSMRNKVLELTRDLKNFRELSTFNIDCFGCNEFWDSYVLHFLI